MTEPKPPALDTEEIDDSWGGESEPAPAKPPAPPPLKPLGAKPPTVHEAVPAEKSRSPRGRRSTPGVEDEDPIEFEAETVSRDSMPTFQHPNPLMYDVPDSQKQPAIPPAPRVPVLPKKR